VSAQPRHRRRTLQPRREIAAALGVKPGDLLVYRIAKGGKVTLARGEPIDRAYLKAVENTLSEWASPEDKAAYDDL
jgi:hypothetical protein